MEIVNADKDQLVASVEAATNQLCAVLRSASDPDVRAVGTWTVRDVGAHLASGIPLYTGIVRGEGSTYTRLDRISELNAAAITAITDRDCTSLADQIESAAAEFVTAVRTTPGDPEVVYHAGILLRVSSVTALLLGEMLIHGYDIARASRRSWFIAPGDAGLVLRGGLTILPYFVDRAAAAGVRASFDIRLRGKDGLRLCLAFDDGSVNVAFGCTESVDCHLSAEPATFLLLMYGRQGPLRSALTGKVIAWGRKPWLAFYMQSLVQRP
ncbi:MAG TPA: maleylpyruvate isomerase family mycothiol-dependent enzyme [Pseudonocardiaceae bacterium]|nr:maleylpyruvate isomerase family mycothiol-dependent enzyme [Pseudonocardiaceae bacterium]